MEEGEQEQSAVRIFVGGLGEAVTGDDLRRLFASLGTVQSIDTIRTKGRSLAYLDFIPSPTDPKSLTKLFSKYNGCAWKGGRLRLEKAKENYLARLKKEWEEEALVNSIQSPSDDDDVPAQNNELEENPNARRASNIPDTKQLRVFFPRLRKVTF